MESEKMWETLQEVTQGLMVWHYCFPKALRDRDELAEYSKSHEELKPDRIA